MDVSIVCVGDELLDGRVRDRNAPRLGERLDAEGHRLVAAHLVPDREDRMFSAFDEAVDEAEFVVVTGGLGPTRDDRTRRVAADWSGRELEFRDELRERLERLFEAHGYTFTENNERQCYVPAGAEVLPSEVGTASGFVLRHHGSEIWFVPGVPREFDWYLEERLLDRLRDESSAETASREMAFLGIGESDLETRIEQPLQLAARRDVEVSFRADAPLVEMQLRGPAEEDVDAARDAILEEVGDWRVSEKGEGLAERLGALLEERGATVATAESCTAGWISKAITDVAGSSAWFEYGFVTYANRAKVDLLGVSSETLEAHGAVSPETVREMAAGARRRSGATLAVAVSGIAGPSGGTDDKPVGTVDFGLATPEGLYTRRLEFPPRSRNEVRRTAVRTALGLLIWQLDGLLDRHSVEGPLPYED